MQLEAQENVDARLPVESLSRTVESEECELFIELITDYDKIRKYKFLGSDLILEIAGKLEYLFLADYLIEHFPIFNPHLANDILLAVKDIYDISEASAYMTMDFEPYFEDDPLLLGAAYCSNIRESSSDDNDSLQ